MTPVPSAVAETDAPGQPIDGTALPLLDPELIPNLDDIITVVDTPVASIFAEKQERLLTEPLYSSWPGPGAGRPFLALANVGLFHTYKQPPVLPDVLLGLDVRVGENLHKKENHSYFVWLMGKPPDATLEIVSDTHGGEENYKMHLYARIAIPYYIIFDPDDLYGNGILRAYELRGGMYESRDPAWLPNLGLGLRLWEGEFEVARQGWLRWCDRDGRVIPTGAELAAEKDEKLRRLEEQLRALGVKPNV